MTYNFTYTYEFLTHKGQRFVSKQLILCFVPFNGLHFFNDQGDDFTVNNVAYNFSAGTFLTNEILVEKHEGQFDEIISELLKRGWKE